MRRAAIVLLAAATAAVAAPRLDAPRRYLEKGEVTLSKLSETKGDSKRLKVLDRAKVSFNRARALARKALKGAGEEELEALQALESQATLRLVGLLNAKTVLYLRLGSYSRARKANEEALALLPEDVRALELEDEIANPPEDEVDATIGGAVVEQAVGLQGLLRNRSLATQRYLERRAAAIPGRPAAR